VVAALEAGGDAKADHGRAHHGEGQHTGGQEVDRVVGAGGQHVDQAEEDQQQHGDAHREQQLLAVAGDELQLGTQLAAEAAHRSASGSSATADGACRTDRR
jgi:hypothetical protein